MLLVYDTFLNLLTSAAKLNLLFPLFSKRNEMSEAMTNMPNISIALSQRANAIITAVEKFGSDIANPSTTLKFSWMYSSSY